MKSSFGDFNARVFRAQKVVVNLTTVLLKPLIIQYITTHHILYISFCICLMKISAAFCLFSLGIS